MPLECSNSMDKANCDDITLRWHCTDSKTSKQTKLYFFKFFKWAQKQTKYGHRCAQSWITFDQVRSIKMFYVKKEKFSDPAGQIAASKIDSKSMIV